LHPSDDHCTARTDDRASTPTQSACSLRRIVRLDAATRSFGAAIEQRDEAARTSLDVIRTDSLAIPTEQRVSCTQKLAYRTRPQGNGTQVAD